MQGGIFLMYSVWDWFEMSSMRLKSNMLVLKIKKLKRGFFSFCCDFKDSLPDFITAPSDPKMFPPCLPFKLNAQSFTVEFLPFTGIIAPSKVPV